jgi:hypothetical protein
MIFSPYRDTKIYPPSDEVPAPFLFTIISDHDKKGKDQGIFVPHNACS